MARVVVDVMLKREILDPQGQAVADALPGLGVHDVIAVRVGRHIELEFDGVPDVATVEELADRLLANPVIEDYTVRLAERPDGAGDTAGASPPQGPDGAGGPETTGGGP